MNELPAAERQPWLGPGPYCLCVITGIAHSQLPPSPNKGQLLSRAGLAQASPGLLAAGVGLRTQPVLLLWGWERSSQLRRRGRRGSSHIDLSHFSLTRSLLLPCCGERGLICEKRRLCRELRPSSCPQPRGTWGAGDWEHRGGAALCSGRVNTAWVILYFAKGRGTPPPPKKNK